MASALTALDGLPKPDVIETVSFEAILAAMAQDAIARLPGLAPYLALESEPSRIILEAAAYRETIMRARGNDIARANLLAFAGGSDLDNLAAFYDVTRLFGEIDARLRERVVLALQGRSTGGTAARYRYVAMSSSLEVADAIVWVASSNPVVNVAVLSTDVGGMARPELLATVAAALNSPDVKMVNDTIAVVSAVSRSIDVVARAWLLPDTALTSGQIEDAIRAAWEKEAGIGFDMPMSWIAARAMVAGVQRVVVTTPAQDVVVNPYEAVSLGAVTVEIAGRDR